MSFNRNLSARLTRQISRTPLKPNHITTVGLIIGVLGGASMASGTRGGMLCGAALLHAAFILDNCDGDLARLKSLQSKWGARYDLFSDWVTDCALWWGLAAGASAVHGSPAWFGWAAAATLGSLMNEVMVAWERKAGFCTSVHSKSPVKELRQANLPLRILDFFSHNGDSIYLVWIMAAIGSPALFLVVGAVYIHINWIWRRLSHITIKVKAPGR